MESKRHQLALHPWQIIGIIIIGVGVLAAVLIPLPFVWFIPAGIGLLILGKISEKWIQFKWIGISLAMSIVISFFVPFPFSLPIIIGVSIWLSFYMRKRALNKNRIERIDTTEQSINSPTQQFQALSPKGGNTMFCRYCGKERDSSVEFCSICGRSAQATSTIMKKCVDCNSLMADDSRFCANCGREFDKPPAHRSPI